MEPSDSPVIAGLAVLSTLLFLLNMRSFLKILPALGDCLNRWKGNVELEDSLQLARSRNLVTAILFIPFCLLIHRYSLYDPRFLGQVPPLWRFPVVAAVFLAYLLLRGYLNWQLELHDHGRQVFTAANRSFFNYAILLLLLLLVVGTATDLFMEDRTLARHILLGVSGLWYLFFLYRRGQIFASVCNPFTTFLYLCGLEILPTGALAASAVML